MRLGEALVLIIVPLDPLLLFDATILRAVSPLYRIALANEVVHLPPCGISCPAGMIAGRIDAA